MAFLPFQLFSAFAKKAWNNITGQTAIEEQNKGNMKLAQYQTRVQEEMYNKYSSPEALMRQYKEAGLNPNLVYGSASAGQGNVPGFSAPHIERNISGSDKVNKALSLLSGISGAAQSVYQATAAKEAAQQSALKTGLDQVALRNAIRENEFQEGLTGLSIVLNPYNQFRKDHGYMKYSNDLYSRYLGEYRQNQFNTWLRSKALNLYDFGHAKDELGNFVNQSELVPYYNVRNKSSWLKYDLMNELGNMGTYGKLAVSLLGTIF